VHPAFSCRPQQRPCKVSDVSSSKTGKHGHAKCHFVAIDIFNGKKVRHAPLKLVAP
jgi:translation elongation factor P/translation initiation factor 5A